MLPTSSGSLIVSIHLSPKFLKQGSVHFSIHTELSKKRNGLPVDNDEGQNVIYTLDSWYASWVNIHADYSALIGLFNDKNIPKLLSSLCEGHNTSNKVAIAEELALSSVESVETVWTKHFIEWESSEESGKWFDSPILIIKSLSSCGWRKVRPIYHILLSKRVILEFGFWAEDLAVIRYRLIQPLNCKLTRVPILLVALH